MTRRLVLAPAVVGAIATAEIIRRAAWLAWPIITTGRSICRRHRPTPNSELDYTA